MTFGGKLNLNQELIKRITDVRNIVLYIFTLVVLAITWSGVKAVQSNYELQKKISALKQQNEVLKLENENAALENRYLETDQYLELTARQNLGLAAPGEKVLLVPIETAMKNIDPSLKNEIEQSAKAGIEDNRSKYAKNLEDWRDFLLGRKLFDD